MLGRIAHTKSSEACEWAGGWGVQGTEEEETRSGKERKMSIFFYKIHITGYESDTTVNGL